MWTFFCTNFFSFAANLHFATTGRGCSPAALIAAKVTQNQRILQPSVRLETSHVPGPSPGFWLQNVFDVMRIQWRRTDNGRLIGRGNCALKL